MRALTEQERGDSSWNSRDVIFGNFLMVYEESIRSLGGRFFVDCLGVIYFLIYISFRNMFYI